MGFEAGRVSKSYLALTEGVLAANTGVIKHPIGRAATGRHVLMSCRGDAIDPRPSQTNYEVLERYHRHTLVKTTPLTGRNHQIRVHLAHLGHPLIGDEFYKAHGQFHPFRPKAGEAGDDPEEFDDSADPRETGFPIRRHALHACRLAFAHPITQLWMEFHSGLPPDFARRSLFCGPRSDSTGPQWATLRRLGRVSEGERGRRVRGQCSPRDRPVRTGGG